MMAGVALRAGTVVFSVGGDGGGSATWRIDAPRHPIVTHAPTASSCGHRLFFLSWFPAYHDPLLLCWVDCHESIGGWLLD